MKVIIKSRLTKVFQRHNIDAITKAYHNRMIRLWKESVAAFINEAIKHIHVDTGMSMASLQPLAAQVRFKTIITEMLRGKGPKKNSQGAVSGFDTFPTKSAWRGRQLGKKAYTLSFGTPQAPQLHFDFKIVVFQYQIHEIGAGYNNSGSAWNSLKQGKIAFKEYFKHNLARIMDVKIFNDWLATGRVPFTGVS